MQDMIGVWKHMEGAARELLEIAQLQQFYGGAFLAFPTLNALTERAPRVHNDKIGHYTPRDDIDWTM